MPVTIQNPCQEDCQNQRPEVRLLNKVASPVKDHYEEEENRGYCAGSFDLETPSDQ